MPASKGSTIILADTNLVGTTDLHHLHLELIHLARFEIVPFVVEGDLVRFEVIAVLVAAVRHQVDVGVSAGAT